MTAKQKREKQQIDALTQRITDIYSGAGAGVWLEEERWPTAEELSNIIPAVMETFGQDCVPGFVWAPRNIHRFDTPRTIAIQLHAFGVRA